MEWVNSINKEHDRMIKNKVWTVIKKKDVPKNADIIDSTWAMKKKANGQYRACLAARGFKQTHGKSFVYHDISSPVVHDITVHIVLTILLMSGWAAHIVDVNRSFLLGEFRENEHIYMKIPNGFENSTVQTYCCTCEKHCMVLKMLQMHFGDYCSEL